MKQLSIEQILTEFNNVTEQFRPIENIERFNSTKHETIFKDVQQLVDLDSVSPVYIIGGYAYWYLSGGFVHLDYNRNGFSFINKNQYLFKEHIIFDSNVKKNNWHKFNQKKFEAFVTELHLTYTKLSELNDKAKVIFDTYILGLKDKNYLFCNTYEKKYIKFGTYATKYIKPYVNLFQKDNGDFDVKVLVTMESYPTEIFKSSLMIDYAEKGKLLSVKDYVQFMESLNIDLTYGFYSSFYMDVLNLYTKQNKGDNVVIIDEVEIKFNDDVMFVNNVEISKSVLYKHLTLDQLLKFQKTLIESYYK